MSCQNNSALIDCDKRVERCANSQLWQGILGHLARDADLEAVYLGNTCLRAHQRETQISSR